LNLGPKRANRIPGRELIIALAGALAGAILLAVSGCGAVAKDSAPRGRPAAARMGEEPRLVAVAQRRPFEHSREPEL
jgi:hypothetical protein